MKTVAHDWSVLPEEQVEPPTPLPGVRSWLDIVQEEGAVLIGPGRWICRGSGVFVVAPSGAGKSTWAATQSFLWALGRESLGLRPAAPLKSLVFQAEDDDGDLADMAAGVLGGMQCSKEERGIIRDSVRVVTERSMTGVRFLEQVVAPLLAVEKPDLLWLNPLSAYFGDDLNDQRAVARFFRNTLNPILAAYRCTAFTVHHIPKPNQERANWSGSELSYAGAGSADLSNWAREVIVLRETVPGLFEMVLTKRWRKVGWTDADGKPTQTRLIAHGRNGNQVWRDATPDVLADLGARPYSVRAFCELVPAGGIDKAELVRATSEAFRVSDRTAKNYVTDGCRKRRHNAGGQSVNCALFETKDRPRKEVYPTEPANRPVVWLTLTPEGRQICER